MSLEKYLNDQHGYGKSQGIGQFTINAAKAKLKLQRYQLNDPLRYLLKIVQAAVAGGAAWVDIKQSRFDTEVIFELPTTSPLTRAESMFSSDSVDPDAHESLEHLLTGISAATQLPCKGVSFHIHQGGVERTIDFVPEGVVQTRESRITLEKHAECCFAIKRSRNWLGLIRGADRRAREQKIIYDNCRHSPIRVMIDGVDVRGRWTPNSDKGWLSSKASRNLNLTEHYYSSAQPTMTRTLATYAWLVKRDKLIWKLPTWDESKILSYGEADSYEKQVFKADGTPVRYEEAPRTISAEIALALNLGLHKKTYIQPIKDGVLLEPIDLEANMPGLTVIGWAPDLRVDLGGFSIIRNKAFERFLERIRRLYPHLVQEAPQQVRPVGIYQAFSHFSPSAAQEKIDILKRRFRT